MATYSNISQNNWFLSKRKRFSELELISFLVLCNFPHVFRIFTAYRSIRWCRLSGKFQIDHDADIRTTTPVETTGFTTFYKRANSRSGIMFPDELIISKIYYVTWNTFCKKATMKKILRIFYRRIILTDFVLVDSSSVKMYFIWNILWLRHLYNLGVFQRDYPFFSFISLFRAFNKERVLKRQISSCASIVLVSEKWRCVN